MGDFIGALLLRSKKHAPSANDSEGIHTSDSLEPFGIERRKEVPPEVVVC